MDEWRYADVGTLISPDRKIVLSREINEGYLAFIQRIAKWVEEEGDMIWHDQAFAETMPLPMKGWWRSMVSVVRPYKNPTMHRAVYINERGTMGISIETYLPGLNQYNVTTYTPQVRVKERVPLTEAVNEYETWLHCQGVRRWL